MEEIVYYKSIYDFKIYKCKIVKELTEDQLVLEYLKTPNRYEIVYRQDLVSKEEYDKKLEERDKQIAREFINIAERYGLSKTDLENICNYMKEI